MAETTEQLKTLAVSEPVHTRLKVRAATMRVNIRDYTDELLTQAMDRAEKREQRKATKAEG